MYLSSKCKAIVLIFSVQISGIAIAGGDLPTLFSNTGGISNTRHNLTLNTVASNSMDPFRNNYAAICVFCHTPHGANQGITAPLWNRTLSSATYTTYNSLGATLTQTVTHPGDNSLACLSCHDGTLAVDSIINMPGSGNYSALQQTEQKDVFLDTWTNAGSAVVFHAALQIGNGGCLACHSPGPEIYRLAATDFTMAVIGTDLTNDHPVGIAAPVKRFGLDFKEPMTIKNGISFYDKDGDSRPDGNEIRFYDTGEGPEVECASCHDPHGVDAGGGLMTTSFLRVSNDGSGVCLSCHDY